MDPAEGEGGIDGEEAGAAGDAPPAKEWCAYVLGSSNSRRTYVGMTNDPSRRIRQHNGELSGGARRTRTGRPWRFLAVVSGFGTMSQAMQAEWRLKRTRSVGKALATSDRWTSRAPPFCEQDLVVYADPSGPLAVPQDALPRRWAAADIAGLSERGG
jgi:predicted GIY-YIG superfamily endonuclease